MSYGFYYDGTVVRRILGREVHGLGHEASGLWFWMRALRDQISTAGEEVLTIIGPVTPAAAGDSHLACSRGESWIQLHHRRERCKTCLTTYSHMYTLRSY